MLPLTLPVVFMLLIVVVMLAWNCWRQRCELGGEHITLIWDAEGRWWWQQDKDEAELVLCGDSYLSFGMVILNFYHPDSGMRRSLVLFPASVGPVRFRRLRVRLLLEGRQSVRCKGENFPE